MRTRLMISVAAVALIAGAGFANAQGNGAGHESGGAAMHSAPAGGAAPGGAMEKSESAAPASGTSSEMKSSQSEQKSPAAAKNQRAEDNMQGQKSKSMSSENETKSGPKEMKSEGATGKTGTNGSMKAEGREGANGNMKAEGKNGTMNAEGKSTTERSQVTTGQAGAAAKLSTEQRTKITSVIRSEHVTPVTNVNFSISVGTRVPRDIEYRPLPTEVVTIYPEWRGYDFVLVRDQIVVIDPQTFEIVAVLDT
jgi:Protein of unknown function (DUF1236)